MNTRYHAFESSLRGFLLIYCLYCKFNFITYGPAPWLNLLLVRPACWDLLSLVLKTELSLVLSALCHGLHPPFSMLSQFPDRMKQKFKTKCCNIVTQPLLCITPKTVVDLNFVKEGDFLTRKSFPFSCYSWMLCLYTRS